MSRQILGMKLSPIYPAPLFDLCYRISISLWKNYEISPNSVMECQRNCFIVHVIDACCLRLKRCKKTTALEPLKKWNTLGRNGQAIGRKTVQSLHPMCSCSLIAPKDGG